MTRRFRAAGAATAMVVGTSMVVLGVGVGPALAASAVVTIDAPTAPVAGTVNLTGNVAVGPGEVTSVLYAFDATESTASPAGSDCSGDGATGPGDDLNGDGTVGDVLDCEIAAVEALNGSLVGATSVQVGLVAFANRAVAADLDPGAGTAAFASPAAVGNGSQSRVSTVARSVRRNSIGLYEAKELGGSGAGTAFNSAIQVALSTLASAPSGPKLIMFASDGQAAIDKGLLQQLTDSGVRLRSFGIGAGATCASTGSLYKMAAATQERCTLAPNPASLTAGVVGSAPDAINGVTVSIKDVSVDAEVDPVGGWRASFSLGKGTYTATVRVDLVSGTSSTAKRTFTVAASAGGPAAGAVAPGPGARRATMVKVTRPDPSRSALPARVVGRVGRLSNGLKVTRKLAGTHVELQARSVAGAPWSTVDRAKVKRDGSFALRWRPKSSLPLLRVVLAPVARFAGSAAAVPPATISSCTAVKRASSRFAVTCLTTARAGSSVTLLDRAGNISDRASVRAGTFRLTGQGRVGQHRIDLMIHQRHVRLAL